jgi:hypothetical protein
MEDADLFAAIRSIFPPFVIFYGRLVYFVVFLVYFPLMLHREKSGNPKRLTAQLARSQSYDYELQV